MIRGTTPTHTFELPFNIPEGAEIRVVYSQKDNVLIEKTTSDCSIENNIVKVTLTSEETLKFNCHQEYYKGTIKVWEVEIQIGIKTKDGSKFWSEIITTNIDRCLKEDGVI